MNNTLYLKLHAAIFIQCTCTYVKLTFIHKYIVPDNITYKLHEHTHTKNIA